MKNKIFVHSTNKKICNIRCAYYTVNLEHSTGEIKCHVNISFVFAASRH